MALLKSKTSAQFVLDPISTLLITIQILIDGYMAVRYIQTDMYVTMTSIVFILLTIAGLALHQAMCGGIKFSTVLSTREFADVLQGTLIGVITVAIAQVIAFQLTPSTVSWITVIERKAFYFSAAISEETFFRFYLQTKLQQILPKNWFSVVLIAFLVSSTFTTWHLGVYANSIASLTAVFFSSLALCFIYAWKKRVSITQLIHAWVNFFAS